MRSIVPALAAALLSCAIVGCAAKAPVAGKVIEGDISFIGVVDPADERLNGPGIPGATIVVRGGDTPTALELAEVVSDRKGDFRLSIADQKALTRPAQFTADKEGYSRAVGVMSIPPQDRRLLIILKPMPAAPRPQ